MRRETNNLFGYHLEEGRDTKKAVMEGCGTGYNGKKGYQRKILSG